MSLYALFLPVRAKRVQGGSGERRGRFDPGVSWLRASGGDGRQAHFATLPLSLRASAPALSAASLCLPQPPQVNVSFPRQKYIFPYTVLCAIV